MFADEDRLIFPYTDPVTGQQRHADPLAVDRAMQLATRGELAEVLEQQRGDDDLLALVAEDRLWPAVRAAFGLTPFDPATGVGATDRQCRAVLDAYHGWVSRVFPGGGTGPSSARPSAVPPVTKSSSGCGCP